MSLTDEPDDIPEAGSPPERPDDDAPSTVPNLAALRWPLVQALRDLGRASDTELVEHVADSLRLTDQQRAEMVPSGQETRIRNRVNWATHELKQIGAVYYPEPGVRALTALGNEIDDDQIRDRRRAFEAEERRRRKANKKDEQVPADPPTAWLIRAGGRGELAESFVENGIVAVGFGQLGDLSEVSSRDEVVALAKEKAPEATDNQVRATAYQLWAFRSEIRCGDLVVMPLRGNSEYALGTVAREYGYRHDASDMSHTVLVEWRRTKVRRTDLGEDLLRALRRRPTVNLIRNEDAARRLQQLLETGQDPGARPTLDLPDLVKQFYRESGYPTEAHEQQARLRAEWAEKLAPENVSSLTREELAAYASFSVDYGEGEYVKPDATVDKWILDLDDARYERLLDSIGDLCWGTDELSTRIDRLVDRRGSRKDTGTKGFTQENVTATLAICHPGQFLPLADQGGEWGREHMLRRLDLPEPQGSTFGQQVVDANARLRKHLAYHLGDDPQAIAYFLYWLMEQAADSGGGDEPDDEAPDLSVLVARFRDESGYPTEAHKEQERLREEWAEKLAPANIAELSRHDLTVVASHGNWWIGTYVFPQATGVMQWIQDLTDEEYSRMLDHIRYLCWDEDELWQRYDQLTNQDSPRKTKGLALTTTSKLLAICHPKDFLAAGVQGGKWGRRAMLDRLGLPKPTGSSLGQRVVDANNRLREHLEPQFGDDTLGMGAFLQWLLVQGQPTPPAPPGRTADLVELAEELLVDLEFLDDIVELLKDKGQVILYGPPGTGKTYLARKLAEALAPEESCRTLVQFHPSTSYEDFFEGYRPAKSDDGGGIRYELTLGPLARIAKQAFNARDRQHVMIIDEINRGNLPRVLGELLFLLEYRDEAVQTLYRPDEPFELPENLWFIGTMNTADRSIALVDAALRRRFHFVPFFPDSGPMAGLLSRWLEREGEPAWVRKLVDAVNEDLKKELEGSHLLLGPSHFMKEYGSSPSQQRERLRRIWEYNVEPFIEDQFFGAPDQIDRFRFNAVMKSHGPAAESDVDASDNDGDDENDQEGVDGPEDEAATADSDTPVEPGSTQPGDAS